MNILITVCGRAGSKGVKGKNTKIFNGYPLVLYTFSVIDLLMEKLNHYVDVAINTDSMEIIELTKSFHNFILVNREQALAGEHVSKLNVIRDTLLKTSDYTGINYDLVLDLDITSPIRTVNDILRVIDLKNENKDLDVVFTVVKSRRSPYFNMVKDEAGIARLVQEARFTARQQVPQTYDMNASIYAYDPCYLITAEHLFDGNCGMVEMEDTLVLDIDCAQDFQWMEYIYTKLLQDNKGYEEVYINIKNIYVDKSNINIFIDNASNQ
ncbi:acylneuraminate cytidylyltransferase family protein [Paenibacillus thiaminolyticus]|nr:acylneuraminate cytidylyltransferase family protein [Paenibacillus thiaminolyticus]